MKPKLYPLTFCPIYKNKVWGARRLESLFGRKLPPGPIGESWDIAAHPSAVSKVDQGELAGWSLIDLLQAYGAELVGSTGAGPRGFPLLLKLIDAGENLSVQVHPGDAYVREHGGGVRGKTEIWYIVHSEPGSWIVWGLAPGITKDRLRQALASGAEALWPCLNRVFVQPGEIYPISAGLVHALGAGVVVAELQQNSDVTYRLYDWGRVGKPGHRRPLHLKQALDVIDFSPKASNYFYQLGRCEKYFKLNILADSVEGILDLAGRFQIVTALGAPAEITCRGKTTLLNPGQSCLLPAALEFCRLTAQGVVLQSIPA